jgi:hypothetical protein
MGQELSDRLSRRRAGHATPVIDAVPAARPGDNGRRLVLAVNQDLSACSAVSAVKAVRRCRCHSAFCIPRSALPSTARGEQVRRLTRKRPQAWHPRGHRTALIVAHSAFCTLHSALHTRNSCSRLTLRKQVSPGFVRPAPLLLIVYLSTVPKVIHNGVCPSVHVKNHQIRIKIDQKGDVFRQKAIKNERISSCPS